MSQVGPEERPPAAGATTTPLTFTSGTDPDAGDICQECGNDLVTAGYAWCLECLEVLEPDRGSVVAPRPSGWNR